MAPKRLRTSKGTVVSISLSNKFSTQEQDNKFNKDFATKNLLWYSLDLGFFEGCQFLNVFIHDEMKDFISSVPKEMFPTLVRMFYSNLNYEDEIITSKVREHLIPLTLQELTKIYDLLWTKSLYKLDEKE